MQARAPGPVASSQQSHLAKLRHTEPGVHETRDAHTATGRGWAPELITDVGVLLLPVS